MLFEVLGLQIAAGNLKTEQRYPLQFRAATSLPANLRLLAEQSLEGKADYLMLPPVTPLLSVEPGAPAVDVLAFLQGPSQIPLVLAGETDRPTGKPQRRAVFTSPDLWELYFRSINTGVSESIADFWQRILGWLVKITGEQTAYFRFNKNKFQQGEQIVVEGSHLSKGRAKEGTSRLQLQLFNVEGERRSYPFSMIAQRHCGRHPSLPEGGENTRMRFLKRHTLICRFRPGALLLRRVKWK